MILSYLRVQVRGVVRPSGVLSILNAPARKRTFDFGKRWAGRSLLHTSGPGSDGPLGDEKDENGRLIVTVDRKTFFRALSGFSVVQVVYWGSVSVFGVLDWYWLGGNEELMAVSPELTALGLCCTGLVTGLTKVFAGKNVGSLSVHPSGRSCSIRTYTPFGGLKERIFSLDDIVEHTVSKNYYMIKLRGDRLFTLIDRSHAKFETDEDEKLLKLLMRGTALRSIKKKNQQQKDKLVQTRAKRKTEDLPPLRKLPSKARGSGGNRKTNNQKQRRRKNNNKKSKSKNK